MKISDNNQTKQRADTPQSFYWRKKLGKRKTLFIIYIIIYSDR